MKQVIEVTITVPVQVESDDSPNVDALVAYWLLIHENSYMYSGNLGELTFNYNPDTFHER